MKENNAYEYHNANLTYILRSLRDNTYINTYVLIKYRVTGDNCVKYFD